MNLLYIVHFHAPMGEFSYKIASQFFDADKLNQKLYELYEIIILGQQIDSNK